MPDPLPDNDRTQFGPAAQAFLGEEAGRLPDLRACTVLVPHFHAADPFLAALRARVEAPVFLPPRVLTLSALADCQPGGTAPEPDALRLVQIQTVLARSGLLAEAALWPAAQELLALLDELSAHLLAPPASFADFRRQCEAAYRRRLGLPLEREARLVFELWRAMAQGERPDRVAEYGRRLALAATRAEGPLYHLGLPALSRLETRFLARWAEAWPVRELPPPAGMDGRATCLSAIWPAPADAEPLPGRAAALRAAMPVSPFVGGLRLQPAHSLEEEAWSAARAIRGWVERGLRRIGIVALDRLAARRLRALLERHQVLLRDETGWTFSTAAVSHVPDRLAALVADDAYYLDLLDLLKSPYVFADMDRPTRLAAVADLERAIRGSGTAQGLERFTRLAAEQAPHCLPLLRRLGAARDGLSAARDSLSGWLHRLLAALDAIGASEAMAADAAGGPLLHLLQGLADDLTGDPTRFRFAEWRGWLLRQLEDASFVDSGIDSPLRLTHLAGARLRDFDAVLLLGADAGHLPGAPRPGLFNEALRAELGLPGEAWRQAEQRRLLADILCQTPEVVITWQASRDGDPNPLSPWLEVLDVLHRLAYGASLRAAPRPLHVPATEVDATPPPRPGLEAPPEQLSASGWQSLVACPYQFFARYGLGLRAQDEVPEEMEKRDYGERVHAILHAFHRQHPRLSEYTRDELADSLRALSEAHFAAALGSHYLAYAWQARWLRQLPAYVDWALAWEGQGYCWQAAEQGRRRVLDLGDGRSLALLGRLDRLDRGPAGDVVLDYKTQSLDSLRRKLRQPGEDVQLPFYGLLAGATEAAFVALDDKGGTRPVPWPADLPAAAAREAERIATTWRALAAGAALPAQGAEPTCRWCEMRGLCRRDYWDAADSG